MNLLPVSRDGPERIDIENSVEMSNETKFLARDANCTRFKCVDLLLVLHLT